MLGGADDEVEVSDVEDDWRLRGRKLLVRTNPKTWNAQLKVKQRCRNSRTK